MCGGLFKQNESYRSVTDIYGAKESSFSLLYASPRLVQCHLDQVNTQVFQCELIRNMHQCM